MVAFDEPFWVVAGDASCTAPDWFALLVAVVAVEAVLAVEAAALCEPVAERTVEADAFDPGSCEPDATREPPPCQ